MGKGLKRHVQKTARRPADLVKRNGEYYRRGTLSPLNDEELEKHEKEQDEYKQKQASVREVFYRTVDKSMFIQVKNKTDAAAVWKKIVLIHADRDSMFETNLFTQLQNSRYSEGNSMHEHLARMVEIKERLAKIDYSLLDESFVSYICTLISLAPSFRSLITTLNASAHETGKKLTSKNLIWHLNEEANSIALQKFINKSNKAMLAATSKAKV
jgi:gag-polypeptide of LTR copia-type